MKNIRRVILICSLFILTGCSIEYNLSINEDLSVKEKIIASEETNRMEAMTKSKGDNAVNYIYDMFKRNDERVSLSSRNQSKKTYTTAVKSHKDIESYSKDFKSDVFQKVNIKKENDIVTFTANQTKPLGNNQSYSLIYDDITLTMYIPFKVIENNADTVSGNTYIWKIKNDGKLKYIKIKYNEGMKKNAFNLKINNKVLNIDYAIIGISGIILVLLIIFIVVAIKNKKNNSF